MGSLQKLACTERQHCVHLQKQISKQWLWAYASEPTHLMQWATYRGSLWYRSSWRKVCTRRSSTTDMPFPSSSDSLPSRNCTNLRQHKPSMCNRQKLGSFYYHNKDIKDVLTYPRDLAGHLQHSFARSPQRPWNSNTSHLADNQNQQKSNDVQVL